MHVAVLGPRGPARWASPFSYCRPLRRPRCSGTRAGRGTAPSSGPYAIVGSPSCISFNGADTDEAIGREILDLVKPAALQAALQVGEEQIVVQDSLLETLQTELQAARYSADRAAKQFDASSALPDPNLAALAVARVVVTAAQPPDPGDEVVSAGAVAAVRVGGR